MYDITTKSYYNVPTRPKLLIIGHARHGKDTLAAILKSLHGFEFKGSSEACAEIFIYQKLRLKYGYKSAKECFEDRGNRRAEWYELISDYNASDGAKLAKEILRTNDVYVGMRSDREIEACIEQKLFNMIIGVYNPRVPEEGRDSFNINLWDRADVVIPNAGTIGQFIEKASKLKLS